MAMRVSGGVALTRSSYLIERRAARTALLSSVGEPSVFDRENQADSEERSGDRRSSVGDERKRNARGGEETDHHRSVHDDREKEHRRDCQDEKHPAAVSRHARERQRSQEQHREEEEHQADSEEPPLLRDHRENEVGVLDGQEAQLALSPRPETLPREAPGAHGDLRLSDLVPRSEDVRLRIQERADPLLLVVRQHEPADAREERDSDDDRDPGAGRKAPEEERHGGERKKRRGETGVRLEKDEEKRDADDHADFHERRALHLHVVLVLEQVREEERGRDLGELGGLELKAADADPGLDVRDPLPEEEEIDERNEGDAVDDEGELEEHPIVEEHRRDQAAEPHENPDRLARRQAVEAPSRRRRRHEQDPEDRERDCRGEDDEVEPPRDRQHPADHSCTSARARSLDAFAEARTNPRSPGRGWSSTPRNFARSRRAIGAAALPPWPPCSTNTTTTIFGSSIGANAVNHAWSASRLRSTPARRDRPAAASSGAGPGRSTRRWSRSDTTSRPASRAPIPPRERVPAFRGRGRGPSARRSRTRARSRRSGPRRAGAPDCRSRRRRRP